jgi:hypothetical protein
MLAIVARSATSRVSTPGPSNTNALFTPPLTVRRRSISKITSFAETQPSSWFSSTTRTMLG